MRLRRFAGSAVTLVLCALASMAHAQEQITPVESIEAPVDAAPAIGTGAYRYQLTLRGEQGEVKRRMPFALSLKTGLLPFVPEEKGVWRGVTDDEGRTPVFALSNRVTAKDVLFRPRFGDGPLGEQMQFVSNADGHAMALHYRLVLCTNPPQQFFGVSDADGFTAYAASDAPAHILAYALDDEPDFIGRDGVLFWNDRAEPGVDVLTRKADRARARQLRANRKACRKA